MYRMKNVSTVSDSPLDLFIQYNEYVWKTLT